MQVNNAWANTISNYACIVLACYPVMPPPVQVFLTYSLSGRQWRDSNSSSHDYESSVLPLCHHGTTQRPTLLHFSSNYVLINFEGFARWLMTHGDDEISRTEKWKKKVFEKQKIVLTRIILKSPVSGTCRVHTRVWPRLYSSCHPSFRFWSQCYGTFFWFVTDQRTK